MVKVRRIKQLGVDSVVYGVGSIATRAIGFLLIPVYTRYLSPSDYGILALLNMLDTLLMVSFGLGQHTAVFRFYFKHPEGSTGRQEVISTYYALTLLASLPFLLLVALSGPLAALILGEASLFHLVILMLCINYLDLLVKVPLALIRARRWTVRYTVFTVLRTLATMSLILLFVAGLLWGVLGSLVGQILASVLATALLYVLMLRQVPARLSRPRAAEMLRYGIPLMLGGLAHFVFRFLNRYFLRVFGDLDQVGLFSLGSRFGEIILFLNTAIRTAWPIFLYQSERDADAPAIYGRAMTYYVAFAGFVATALVVFLPEIYALLVDERFHASRSIVPTMAAAYLLMGVGLFGDTGIKLKEQTTYSLYAAAATAVVSLFLNLTLIPWIGVSGAALSTMLSCGCHAAIVVLVSQRLYRVRYELRRLALLVAVLAAAALSGAALSFGGLVTSLVLKAAIVGLGVPAMLLLLGFFVPEERAQLRRLLGGLRQLFA